MAGFTPGMSIDDNGHVHGTDGRYQPKQHSQAEAALPIPDPENRPVSDTIALTGSDDDEFFDAPVGTVLEVDVDDRYTCTGMYGWQRERDGAQVEAGAVWASLHADDDPFGDLNRDAVLRLPDGWTHSTKDYFQRRA